MNSQKKTLRQCNLTARLALLILLAILPVFALYVFSSYQQMQVQEDGVREAALRLVRVMKASHMQAVDDAKSVLKAMSQFPSLREQDAQRCESLRTELAQKFPGYTGIGLASARGDVICATGEAAMTGSVASMSFFSEALIKRDVGIGPYEFDPAVAVPRVFVGVPVVGEDKRINAVMFASLSLSHFEALPHAAQLSRESIIVVFDDAGVVLARYPDPQGWKGTNQIASSALVSHVRGSLAEEDVIDVIGADKVPRLFAYARIHKTPGQSVYLATGIPAQYAYADARGAFRNDILILVLVFFVVIGIAWLGAHRLVVRKIGSLTRVAARIRNGDLAARSGLVRSGDEIGELAAGIDAMADAIQTRVGALQRHGAEMRELKEMNDALQSCVTQDEVLAVVRQFALKLFPEQPGSLYLMHESGDYLEAKTRWANPSIENEFLPQECWAVRRGKIYLVASDSNQPRCHHVFEPPPSDYVCAPLMVQGEMLGVLHLENDQLRDRSGDQPLVQAVAEHIALTLANLRLRETLHAQAMRDGLTGLFNRRFMEESLTRETRNAARHKTQVSIIMVDIDHFKRFNDTFGHAAGDALLREVGKMLQTQMRGGDLACRYGGEEFTVILPGTLLHNAADIAEKLRESAGRLRVIMDGQPLSQVTISLGVASFPAHGDSWESVLHAADLALLQAKQTRNRTIVYGAEDAAGTGAKVGT